MVPLAGGASGVWTRGRFRALDCYCQGSSSRPGQRSPSGDGGRRYGAVSRRRPGGQASQKTNLGFAGLATLLQQRLAEQQQQQGIAKDKVRKKDLVSVGEGGIQERESFSKSFKDTNFILEDRSIEVEREGSREEHSKNKRTTKLKEVDSNLEETSSHGEVLVSTTSPSEPSSAFSEAVLAALQQSALERQQRKIKRRTMTRRNLRGKEEQRQDQEQQKSFPEDLMRPIVAKPEWGTQIGELQHKLDLLKQQYYKNV